MPAGDCPVATESTCAEHGEKTVVVVMQLLKDIQCVCSILKERDQSEGVARIPSHESFVQPFKKTLVVVQGCVAR